MAASVTSWLLHLHGPVVYIVVGLLVFFEVAIVVGFFVPGEIASIIGGVIASQHHANVGLMVVVVVVAATVGNVVGYDVGRMIGPWLFAHRPLAGHVGVAKAQSLIARRAGPAVVVGRFVVFARAVLPGLVGMSGMSRRHFALFSAAGGILWGTLWVLVGFGLGLSYTKVTSRFGPASVIVVAVLVVAWVIVDRRRRRRRRLSAAHPTDEE
ncbi:MAG TPA: DedA family protein [Acidimicrobiales bacterium]|nr:DedA family protein [Acidimicrobiales bacterium]